MKLKYFSFIILAFFCARSHAQRLPNKQSRSLLAPHSPSIDGNLAEWQNKFQAFNKSTELFYTLSNDDMNLYLVIRSGDPLIARKMLHGITFSLSTNVKQVGTAAPSFTFPLIDWKVRSPILSAVGKQTGAKTKDREVPSDSLINAINLQLNQVAKIKTTGLANSRDTVTFIKNSKIIKAVGKFDKEFAFTYEFAVPLKQLGQKGNTFLYNVKLNGSNPNAAVSSDGTATINADGRGIPVVLTVSPNELTVQLPTDFTAEYTLIRK